jgi:putative tryptophan/tyrosine transport system substrate-binding protein
MRRREVLLLAGVFAASRASAVRAQPPAKQYRIVIADPAFTAEVWRKLPLYRPLFPELRRLGEVEGQNLIVEYFTAEGNVEHYADLARRVVERDPDVIVCLTGDLVPALIKETRTIPIVAFMANPVFVGSVSNLARPGGNLTGVNIYVGIEIEGKRLELLKEAVPRASRVAVLNTRREPVWEKWRPKLHEYAEKLGISLSDVLLRDPSPSEIERGFAELACNRPDALLAGPEPALGVHAALIVGLAKQSRLPAMYPYATYAEYGGLMTYTFDPADLARQLANDVHQVLHGAKPGDIPIYQATRFKLTINLLAAKELAVTSPPAVLAAADEIIE